MAWPGFQPTGVRPFRRTRSLETDFRKLLGTSIRSKIEESRMNAVTARLGSGLSVTQTARELHYRSANALTRAFRRHFGQSIRDWQRTSGQDD